VKKSLFTFGLLASLLVMLAIMPFLNQPQNSFSNTVAMAQEYDKYGDSSYSQYPTDDKKYECRTGPFEGFFVSSVEFCKHIKFDNDRKDNNKANITGTQGPPGPQGLPGTPGLQGPPGITNVNASNYYSVIGNASTIPSTTTSPFVNSTVSCLPGDVAISGEYNITIPRVAPGLFDILYFGSIGPDPPTNWSTQIVGFFSGITVQTTVNCFDNPPLRP
jgi:hypothetical protein